MGLDMYVNRGEKEVMYWRKEPAIHDWFENHYDGEEVFNCVDLPITPEMIRDLIEDIENQNLNYNRTGFFFGSNSGVDKVEWGKERIAELEKVLKEMEEYPEDNFVYTSWW